MYEILNAHGLQNPHNLRPRTIKLCGNMIFGTVEEFVPYNEHIVREWSLDQHLQAISCHTMIPWWKVYIYVTQWYLDGNYIYVSHNDTLMEIIYMYTYTHNLSFIHPNNDRDAYEILDVHGLPILINCDHAPLMLRYQAQLV